jgi:hypothetical protein
MMRETKDMKVMNLVLSFEKILLLLSLPYLVTILKELEKSTKVK